MAYLFTHFTNDHRGDREQIWFSVGRDGLIWTDLGGDEPYLTCEQGTTGIRDPFAVYDEKLKKYFIIATDLCTTKGGNWNDYSSRGSKKLIVWESENLVDWTEPRLVEVAVEKAGNAWAPEAVYCKEKESWFVFFASNVREKGELFRKQRIYGTFTKDFVSFTPTFKFMERKVSLIDTNIVYDNGWYYRFTKDETNKVIVMDKCRTLVPEGDERYEEVDCELFRQLFGVEGPECYQLPDGRWCLIVDQYHTSKGYLPLVCDDLSSGKFCKLDEGEYDMAPRKKRHGGIIRISDEEYDRLVDALGVCEYGA